VINKLVRRLILFSVIAASGMVTAVMIAVCFGNGNTGEPNQTVQKAKAPQPNEPPMIIWHYSSFREPTESLRLALSSGLITHVSVGGTLHRKDRNYKTNTRALEAIKIIKSSGTKFIWVRWLWPGYSIEQSRLEDLFDPNYYIQEIDALRAEANEVGADFIMLDPEGYGNTLMRKYTTGKRKLNTAEQKRMEHVIKEVIDTVGKVDFILVAGGLIRKWPESSHCISILRELGQHKICERTYYNNEERIKSVEYEYDIFGAYINAVRENKRSSKLPYFLVPEIFQKSYLWSDKKGLWLYPKERNSLAIAKELVAYSRKLPFKSSQQQKRPDSAPK